MRSGVALTSPYSAEVKNEWSCTADSPVFLHGLTRTSLPSILLYYIVCVGLSCSWLFWCVYYQL